MLAVRIRDRTPEEGRFLLAPRLPWKAGYVGTCKMSWLYGMMNQVGKMAL